MSGLNLEQQYKEDNDERNFNLDVLGGFFGYTPKNTRKVIETLKVKNQKSVNGCVCYACTTQKEIDEKVELSPSDAASDLVNLKLMNESGTSIQALLKRELDRGIAEEQVVPTNPNSFRDFAGPQNLTLAGKENAALHKSKSFWSTRNLDTVLEQLDNDRIGVTGMMWYTGFNAGGVLSPNMGQAIFGHCITEIGYDLDYHGQKVVIFQNSYGENWGDGGKFYVRFEDFNKIIGFSSYFVLDIDKDLASWLSLNASKAIIEQNGPKVYVIQGNEKRWIPNEAMMELLGILPQDLVHDIDNMLSQVKEGTPMSLDDIPPTELEHFKRQIILLNNPVKKAQFKAIFPDII